MTHSREPQWRAWLAGVAVIIVGLSSMLLAGCALPGAHAGGAHANATAPVAWQLMWEPGVSPQAPAISESPQQAFAALARVQTDTGALQLPVLTTWLMQGPTIALALVQLDPAGQRMGLAVLVAEPDSGSWALDSAVTLVRPSAQDAPASLQTAKLLPLPATGYQVGGFQHYPAPPYAMQLWLSPSQAQQTFVLARLTGHSASPGPGSMPVTMQGRSGWQLTSNGVTSVVVPLANGEVVVFAGLSARAQVTSLAGAAVEHRDSLLHLW